MKSVFRITFLICLGFVIECSIVQNNEQGNKFDQNLFDKQDIFELYSNESRNLNGLNGSSEWPIILKMLPHLSGSTVADLGCGYGWFSNYARQNGAKHVLCIDISTRMFAQANNLTNDSAITFNKQDLEHLKLTKNTYDLVYSAFVFYYIENLAEMLQTIYDSLKVGGYLVFSIGHPLILASEQNEDENTMNISTLINYYQEEGKIIIKWEEAELIMQHRKIATYINLLVENGFVIKHMEEFVPNMNLDVELGFDTQPLLISAQKPFSKC